MIGTHRTGDFDLSDGTKVEVEYNYFPGGFSDEEDQLELVRVCLIESGDELVLPREEEQRLREQIYETMLDIEHEQDWRNEW